MYVRSIRHGNDGLARGLLPSKPKDLVARGDLVARLGGDEFVVVRNGPHDKQSSLASAREIATSLGGTLSIGEHTIVPSVSIGITLCPDQGTNLETIMRNADLAMYAGKGRDQGSVRVFESAMTQFLDRNIVPRTRSGRRNR